LTLQRGDVLEVVSDSSSGWLYGFHVDRREQLGYFPENRVSWIGRPLNQGPFGTASSCSLGVPEGNAEADIVLESARPHSSQHTGVVASSSRQIEEDLVIESARPQGKDQGRGQELERLNADVKEALE